MEPDNKADKKQAPDMGACRVRIDNIDTQIVDLLNERVNLASRIGQLKNEADAQIYVPEREKQVLSNVTRHNRGPIKNEALSAVFSEIMSAAISHERKLVIAYLGPEATFTHQAAMSKFGKSVDYLGVRDIVDIFDQVERKNADYGVVPVENSIGGAVTCTSDVLVDTRVQIYAELYREIKHNLISCGTMASITEVYSKSPVFAQCRVWLRDNMPNATLIDCPSTADAVRKVGNDPTKAAIGCSLAAQMYHVPILKSTIQDFSHNITRFLVVGPKDAKPTGDDKTSMVFACKDRVGVLQESLMAFARNGINMTRIESRPSKKKAWEYVFFVDFLGHRKDAKVQEAINELQQHCVFVKILGSYPRFVEDR